MGTWFVGLSFEKVVSVLNSCITREQVLVIRPYFKSWLKLAKNFGIVRRDVDEIILELEFERLFNSKLREVSVC